MTRLKSAFSYGIVLAAILAGINFASARTASADDKPDVRVGAAAVNLKADDDMPLAGSLEARFTKEQEGELRATTVVVEKPGQAKIAIVACDVLWVPRDIADNCVAEIEKATGIPPGHVLINATHTHSAPSTAPAHAFGVSQKFREEVRGAIIKSVIEANKKLEGGDARFFFRLAEENTVGANSRLLLDDGNITWINPARESAGKGKPTGPFDPQLPVLDFRNAAGKTLALIYNHSTHTIGTRAGRDLRSPSFYGLTAQELEQELGGIVSFLEGASGSTHNVTQVPVAECIERLKNVIRDAREKAQPRPVARVAGIRRPFKFRVRKFNDEEEDAKIARYTTKYTPQASDRIREIFANMRKELGPQQGLERETWVQAVVVGDVAIVGVPAEYFTVLGVDIKKRSPFKHTYVAELANDWVGYLPDREGHRLGGYQTWMGLHSYAEEGTGERVADLAIEILNELARKDGDGPASDGAAKTESPRTPEDERSTFHLADPNLTIELVASEPDVVSPVAIAWDASGRMYVAEYSGYPDTPGLGRIRRLTDRDGDGQHEEVTTFAEGLNFPASIMPFRDGLLVADSPDILFVKDNDGDGQVDERRIEWTGFVPGSQQLRANSLHWGLDNWIYGANGRCDGEITRPAVPDQTAVSIRGRDFRFRPDGSQFEPLAGQSQFGQVHDDWGNRFLSWNTIPIRHAVVPDRYLARNPQLAALAVVDIADPGDEGRVFGISAPPRQFNAERADYYNALCGLTIHRGDGLGTDYAGNAFVGESLANLVTRRVIRPNGPTFVSQRIEKDREFFASTDNWFHPVNMATGPDGCLYVVDFYRDLVEHPLYVGSPELRRQIDWRRGAEHGRIWRIRRKDFEIPNDRKAIALNSAPPEKLVEALSHPVAWWRETAQRLLVERQKPPVVLKLRALLHHPQSSLGRLHALWTLEGLGELREKDILTALSDSEEQIRRHAIILAEARFPGSRKLEGAVLRLVAAEGPLERYQLAWTIGAMEPIYWPLIAQLIARSRDDSWTLLAALTSAVGQAGSVVQQLVQRDPSWFRSPTEKELKFLYLAGREIGARSAEDVLKCVRWVSLPGNESAQKEIREATLGGMVLLAGIQHGLSETKQDLEAILTNQNDNSDYLGLISRFRDVACATVADDSHPQIAREAALRLFTKQPDDKQFAAIVGILKSAQVGSLLSAAAICVHSWESAESLQKLFAEWPQLPQPGRRAILVASIDQPTATQLLLDEIEAKRILPIELPLNVDSALRASTNPEIRTRVDQLLGRAQSSDRAAVIENLRDALSLAGNSERGALLFKQNCVTCHTVQGFGRKVGPDLSGIGARPVESLIVDVLDPSRQVSPDYASFVAILNSGRVETGLLVSDSADSITLRRAEGEDLSIPRSEIEELRATGKSLMPDGVEQKVDQQGLADLLAFLRAPDRTLLGSR